MKGAPEMDHFTPVDTLDVSTYFRSIIQPSNSFALHWVMPVTGFENNGQPVTPPGFDKEFGLYLTVDASGTIGGAYTSLNATLWADPKNDAGTPSATETDGATFSNGMANDIVLATGTMVSASMQIDPTTLTRHADYVESMTPTLAGTLLLHGSIAPGSHLEEQLTTPADVFQAIPQPDGTTVDLVNGGAATVTLSNPDGSPATISIPTDSLLKPALKFLYHPRESHRDA
jgi:hypothetical protein